MGTSKELGLRPNDVATAVSAHAKPNGASMGISLTPDTSWVRVSNYTVDPPVEYRVTTIRVTEVTDDVTQGEVIATNDPFTKVGQPTGIHSGFVNFVGGEGERTYEELKTAGVEIHEVYSADDKRQKEPSIKVEQRYKTIGAYMQELRASQPPYHWTERDDPEY